MSRPKCLICGKETKRNSSKFCSRACSGKNKSNIHELIPKKSLIEDYKINKMTWVDLCKKYNVSLATIKKYINKYPHCLYLKILIIKKKQH